MGSCVTKSDVQANAVHPPKSYSSQASHQNAQPSPGVKRLLNCQNKLQPMHTTLLELQNAMEEQAREFIKMHKRGKGIAALKRLRLYANVARDIQRQLEEIENALMQNRVSPQIAQKISSRTDVISADFNDAVKIIGPLNPGETVKQRESKAISVFFKHHIQNPDVYHSFALMEAEVNGITMTTSTAFQKSDAQTQPNSLNNFDEKENDIINLDYMSIMSEGARQIPNNQFYGRKQCSV